MTLCDAIIARLPDIEVRGTGVVTRPPDARERVLADLEGGAAQS